MKLQMHSIHFDADQKLLDYIQKKTEKLDTFYDRITGGEVFLRINKDTALHENKIIEIKVSVPGHVLFAKESSSSFEAAADEAMEALKGQIKKFKEKQLERV